MGNSCFFSHSTKKSNKRTKRQNFRKFECHQNQCFESSQIPSQDFNYNPFLSFYKIMWRNDRNELTIYDTEKEQEIVKILDTKLPINEAANITQLSNGDLFLLGYGGMALIIDKSYSVRYLPCGVECTNSLVIYFDKNVYCFGGHSNLVGKMNLSRKFDINKNLWIKLAPLPEPDFCCHSVIFNGNILISGFVNSTLWLYSIEIDSFSAIPYDFETNVRKVLVNAERLYLIQWIEDGMVYDSDDAYIWNQISKLSITPFGKQIYWVYNKEKIYISVCNYSIVRYFQFDLKNKDLTRFSIT